MNGAPLHRFHETPHEIGREVPVRNFVVSFPEAPNEDIDY